MTTKSSLRLTGIRYAKVARWYGVGDKLFPFATVNMRLAVRRQRARRVRQHVSTLPTVGRRFPRLLAVLAAPFIVSCGTYPLGTSTPARGQSAQQHQLDRLACKDEAQLAANSAGNQLVNGVLSATVLLEPIAYERDKSTQRAAFARCMSERGYSVTSP